MHSHELRRGGRRPSDGRTPVGTLICTETGRVYVRIDPRYFRPTEVDLLIGNPAKAKAKLGWTHDTKWEALCEEMVAADLIAVARERRGNGE